MEPPERLPLFGSLKSRDKFGVANKSAFVCFNQASLLCVNFVCMGKSQAGEAE